MTGLWHDHAYQRMMLMLSLGPGVSLSLFFTTYSALRGWFQTMSSRVAANLALQGARKGLWARLPG